MKNKNLKISLIFAVAFLLTVCFYFQVQAATTVVQADMAPRIYVAESHINKISGNEIQGEFTVTNNEAYYLSDLNYEIKLFQGISYTEFKLVDVVVPNEIFFVAPGATITKTFKYTYPKNIISGDYTLRAQVITTRGTELGWNDTTTPLSGTNKFLDIFGDSSSVIVDNTAITALPNIADLQIGGAKSTRPASNVQGGTSLPAGNTAPVFNRQVATPLEGITVSSTDSVAGFLRVQNNGQAITVIPQIKIYKRQFNMPLVKEYKDTAITFAKGETKDISLKMPKLDIPESYLAEVKFYQNNEQVSGIQYFRWVVEGLNGKIIYLKADKDYYKAGDNINLIIQTTGPADASDPGLGKLDVSISNNNKVIAQTTKDVNLGGGLVLSAISILVKEDIVAPIINVKLTKDGKILDQQTINLPIFSPQAKEIEKTQWFSIMYIIGLICLAVLLVLIVGLIFLKNKGKK